MKLTDILWHPDVGLIKLLPGWIQRRIRGRLCASPHLWVLNIIKQIMGETCKIYLEIGVMHGGSMCVAIATPSPCCHVGIDPFKGFYDKPVDPYSGVPITWWIARKNIKANNPYDHPFKLIKGLSTAKRVVRHVRRKYPVIDLLFIDGSHTKAAVTADFANYGALVRVGGIVVFDNYGDPSKPGVRKAVEEIQMDEWDTVGVHGHALILQRK